MTLRTLNYGNYGIFLIMGNAGFLSINRIDYGSGFPPEAVPFEVPGSLGAGRGFRGFELCRLLGSRFRGLRVRGLGFKVQGFKVRGLGFKVQGFKVRGSGSGRP